MPTISVDKLDLFELLGKQYAPQDFEDLCFEFGIELDDDTTEEAAATGARAELKIEIPANRYDMLCIEGIAQALNEFLGNSPNPDFKLVPAEAEFTLTVDESTAAVRPYAAGAILRNITFTQRSYESFIALQDKLHVNLCRNRTLVAMGTHDLDKLVGPITYEALAPTDFKFVPLNQSKEMTGEQLMAFYEKDKNLGKYLHIIRDAPVYPVMLDANRQVASMPPIINSDLSKITLDTRNVFIDITATDKTKAEVVVNTLVAMFSRYCDEPFTVEPVRVISAHNGESRVTPNIAPRTMSAEVSYINSCLGLELSAEEICQLLVKMALKAVPSPTDANLINVSIPCTRPDILHQCDIMEDAAIAYGYANMTASKTPSSSLVAAPLPINKVSDILRIASAQSGYAEVMPLTLCSHDENFAHLRQVDDNTKAVKLANPKSIEYQVVRTTLLPGLLKTVKENRKHSLPIKVFESGDIVLKDDSLERGAFNQRQWCAMYVGKTSGFEYVQGLLGKVMQAIKAPWIAQPETGAVRGYWIEQDDNKTFFEGRGAKVMFRAKEGAKAVKIGEIGVLHPEVLQNFDIPYAASVVEINAKVFL